VNDAPVEVLAVPAPPDVVTRPAGRRVFTRVIRAIVGMAELCLGAALGAALTHEVLTSAVQARLLSEYSARLTFELAPGPSQRTVFPADGPFDHRRGYSKIGDFQTNLISAGYRVAEQARMSPEAAAVAARGVTPPYREPATTGLVIRESSGNLLFDHIAKRRSFETFEDIPPLLTESLLFIENRELLQPFDPRSNPVVEWDRLAKASVLFVGEAMGLTGSVQGGSTLATQLEKYRHSPAGRTSSALDKLRQMAAASLRAYHDGLDTRPWRRQIVVDYFNTLPLAATPGYGELYGLGEGLAAWFGVELEDVVRLLTQSEATPEKVRAYKQSLALLAAVRAPTQYLVKSRQSLERRVNDYTRLFALAGAIDPAFAHAVEQEPLVFLPHAPVVPPSSFVEQKALNATRSHLMQLLGIGSVYDLNRLHLQVDTTFNAQFQAEVIALFQQLQTPEFVAANGLKQKRMLQRGDPSKVLYSLLLFERTPEGNFLRVQADSSNTPLDINEGMKMELGSTAKVRTLAHYFEIMTELHRELGGMDPKALAVLAHDGPDPLTRWAAETLRTAPQMDLDAMLQRALDRRYSASPGEVFFTGGGIHTFENFDRSDNRRILPVREALRRSTNLVFIRLMRDLVRFHEARLPYNAQQILSDPQNPQRQQLLREIASDESRVTLSRAYRRYHGRDLDGIIPRLLGSKAKSPRHLAILFFAWRQGSDEAALAEWLQPRVGALPPQEVSRLFHAYDNPRLTRADFAYLLRRHPIDLWCAEELALHPNASWDEVLERSGQVRQDATSWLFGKRARGAQNVRLRIRIEQDAFARMTVPWQQLGFPFKRLVPSYATAIGSSTDRPDALADLMGIILNDGWRRPLIRLNQLHFAEGTPYETRFEPMRDRTERVMDPVVARTLRAALADVVANGTARRLSGAFRAPDGTRVVAGGKTGSGDNRFQTFNRWGGVTSSHAINRTATFVFYIGDRYFGVITALVLGREAEQYEFTSSLPVSVLRLAAPLINARL